MKEKTEMCGERMKVLIFSDTHGRAARVRALLRLHRDADCAVFLGDGLGDIDACRGELPMPLWEVRGNCDGFPALWEHVPTEQIVALGGHRLLLTHGHLYGAKSGCGALIGAARRADCDIVLFGHTHERYEAYIGEPKPLYLFNPGSLGSPRGGNPSYGLLQADEKNILFSHGEL